MSTMRCACVAMLALAACARTGTPQASDANEAQPAVPAPGPAAAQPPPWRRMPGHEVRDEAPLDSDEAGLLDDGPTAFLEAPRFTSPPAKDGAAAAETGGWARATARSRPPRQSGYRAGACCS